MIIKNHVKTKQGQRSPVLNDKYSRSPAICHNKHIRTDREHKSMLKELHLRGVGPAPEIRIEFADRLNIFTGDNGLGKSFVLDVAWWGLTGNWTERPAYPQRGSSISPEITCQLANSGQSASSLFDFSAQKWQHLQITPEWLVIYVRTDGAFSLFDPARQPDRAYNFTPDTLTEWLAVWGERGVVMHLLIAGCIDDTYI